MLCSIMNGFAIDALKFLISPMEEAMVIVQPFDREGLARYGSDRIDVKWQNLIQTNG
jgi:hypothetical protein